ncbi:MAG: 50S ribosomal protein L25 [Opitutales bacterium]|nr:50S ribosomal protein L25 [Opitutales bacterium]
MKQINLNSKVREGLGRSESRKLRKQGLIPSVIYGESGVRHLTIKNTEFLSAWKEIAGRAALLELKTEGDDEAHFAIIQEAQRNPVTDAFEHIDFKEVVRGRDMEASIPVHTFGVPHGVKNYGGVLEVNLDEIQVRCRPRDLPELIEVDVSKLEIGKSIHLSEIAVPEGVTFLDDEDLVVASCVGASSGASSAVDAEAEAEDAEKEAADAEKEAEASAKA